MLRVRTMVEVETREGCQRWDVRRIGVSGEDGY